MDSNQRSSVVVIGLPLWPVDSVMEHAVLVVVGVGLLTLVLAFFIATWSISRSFRPLARVEKTAAAIAAGDLSRRVEIENPNTEVGRLGSSLNAMLAHIETAFAARMASEARMRRFAADASHELRTPLVTIRGFSELYRHGALSTPEDVATAMGRIESEAKRMGAMVEDLLLLARIDEQRPLQQKPADLLLIANDAVVDTQASDRGRVIIADRARRRRPRHRRRSWATRPSCGRWSGTSWATPCATPPRARPLNSPSASGPRRTANRQSVIEVRDHGPGVPDEEAARIFERFYRADTSRTRETGGSGLGLAIVAAIVGSHSGTVRVDEDRRRRRHPGGQPSVPGRDATEDGPVRSAVGAGPDRTAPPVTRPGSSRRDPGSFST